MKYLFYTLIITSISFLQAHASPTILPDSTVEVQLSTVGGVEFTGASAAGGLKALTTKAQNPADTIIKKVEDSNKNVKIVNTAENAGKSHGNTQINVPTQYKLNFQTANGEVKLTDLNSRVRGQVANGAITATRVKGKIDVFTSSGNISVSDSDADGVVMTQSGNINLQDVRSGLSPVCLNGTVTVKTTSSYFGTQKASPMNLNYDRANLDIAAAPEGGSFNVAKGNINIATASKAVQLRTDEGDANVNVALAGVRVQARKGKSIVKIALNSTSTEPIQIETGAGDAELWIPRNFSGDFTVSITQTKDLDIPYRILSAVVFDKITAEDSKQGGMVVSRQIHTTQKIGTAKRIVRIKATNGNVYIKYW